MKLNTFSKWIAAAALIISLTYSARPDDRMRAQGTCMGCPSLHFTFGMVGITPGQTARLNVVNAIPVGAPNLPIGPPTHATLMFVDGTGNPFNIGGVQMQTTLTLIPGQSAFLDLNGDALPIGPPNIPGGTQSRTQIRAMISECDGCAKGLLIPTLEVFENATGKTTLLMPDTNAIKPGRGD